MQIWRRRIVKKGKEAMGAGAAVACYGYGFCT